MVRSRLILWAGCVLAISQFGCSDPGPEECDREVTVEVSGSAGVPTFDWIPLCSLHSLEVSDAANRAMWWIETPDDRNALHPPVVYGELPDGVTEVLPPAPLQTGGITYTVTVRWIDRSNGQILLRLGDEKQFIP
jgi:hypothetical protein